LSRRGSLTSLINAVARDAARQAKENERAQLSAQRAREQASKASERQRLLLQKEEKAAYLEQRAYKVEDLNYDLSQRIKELEDLLNHTLNVDDTIRFTDLKNRKHYPSFVLPDHLAKKLTEPNLESFSSVIEKPNKLIMFLPGVQKKYDATINAAQVEFEKALDLFQKQLAEQEEMIIKFKSEYEKNRALFEDEKNKHNLEIDEFQKHYEAGEGDAIVGYCSMVLERSSYPNGFPQEFRLAYSDESKELVVDYELPSIKIVPVEESYKFIKTKDEIISKQRKTTDIASIYQDVVASVCLRTIHELLEADQGNWLDVIVFNGFVSGIDSSTGKNVRPCIISIRTTKERFSQLILERVDKRACLRNLGAQLSPRPNEMVAIKPVVTFDMVDKRFVQGSDVLSDLDVRPNIMDLTPFEFENLVSNLFSQIGFETKQTRSSKDGGVDAVAFDNRPILGGKVVIQAKRYKNVVGVSAVRDLYGTMINEGASKGILVTTSHYGPDAYNFANDKPIELIDGGGLIYLLNQNGVEAKIIFEST